MSDAIRVLIVDDQVLFREGLKTLLELSPEIEVVGEAGNGQEALDLIAVKQPQVVLMDLNMPVKNGVETTREITERGMDCKVLVLTTFDDDERIFEALKAGASGYLLKDTPSAQLIQAVRTVNRGESFLQPSVASRVVAELNRLNKPKQEPVKLREPLSIREEEVLAALAEGMSNKEIGGKLSLAEGTVKNHVSNILGKLGVMDRTQAALKARDLGIL